MIRAFAAALFSSTCLVAFATPVAAQAATQTSKFDVPAGSLRTALDAFARQSGRQVIFRGDEVGSQKSRGVQGVHAAEDALDTILSGTGFAARRDASGAFAVVRAAQIAQSGATLPDAAAGFQEAGGTQLETQGDHATSVKDDIVVTGTSISGVKPVGTEAIVITREAAEKTGFTTAADLLRTLPQVRIGEFDREGGASTISVQNAGGANVVSLRGITSTSSTTLVLVDGRRTVGTGANSVAVEANQVPLAALQRVEVVADGASAVYGSDAIGGVINYILRKDYTGGEVSIRANNTAGAYEYGASATGGISWKAGGLGRGNLMLTYDYAHRDPYRASKSPYLRNNLSPLGGPDLRLNGGNATVGYLPSIVVTPDGATNPPQNTTLPRAGTSVYYGVPAGAGAGLTVGQLLLNQPDLTDFSNFTEYVGKQERHQLALYLNQELGESLELFVQGRYTNRETLTRTTGAITGGTITVALPSVLYNTANQPTAAVNPYYIFGIPSVSQGTPANPGIPGIIPPTPAQPAASLNVLYPVLKDFGARTYRGSDDSINVTAGLRAKLPFGWESELAYTIGRNQGCTYCMIGSYINNEALQYQINIGAINPLSSEPLTDDLRSKVTGTQRQIGHNRIDIVTFKANGPLFSLPGGTVRAAVGGEYNKIQNWNENTSVDGINNVRTVITDKDNSFYSRSVSSAFGEVYVPVIDDDMNFPLIKKLVVSAAVRYDKYTDAGSSTNPKFGFDWQVADFLSFGGTWGTSFRAPSITDTNPDAYVSGFIFPLTPLNFNNLDPRITPSFCFSPELCFTNAGWLLGSNEDLRPEEATNWSLNAKFNPGGGFNATINYYNINFRNRLVFPNVAGALAAGPIPGSNPPNYGGYNSAIIPINNPTTCSNSDISSADPALQPFLRRNIYTAGSGVGQLGGFQNFCSIQVLLDQRFRNLAQTFTDGLDFSVNWQGQLGEWTLAAGATANWILNYKERVEANGPDQDLLGLLRYPVEWRGRGNASVYWRGASATMFANYTGPFTNNEARGPTGGVLPNQRVPSYTTFDLNLGYQTTFEGRNSPLNNLRYSLTIQNLFNDYPPPVFQDQKVVADVHGRPFGRTVAFQITAGF